jgi:hypothetical protein
MPSKMFDVGRIVVLYRKYVGGGEVDVKRLREVVRREAAAAEKGKIKVSPGLLAELRADRAYVGKIAKIY